MCVGAEYLDWAFGSMDAYLEAGGTAGYIAHKDGWRHSYLVDTPASTTAASKVKAGE